MFFHVVVVVVVGHLFMHGCLFLYLYAIYASVKKIIRQTINALCHRKSRAIGVLMNIHITRNLYGLKNGKGVIKHLVDYTTKFQIITRSKVVISYIIQLISSFFIYFFIKIITFPQCIINFRK